MSNHDEAVIRRMAVSGPVLYSSDQDAAARSEAMLSEAQRFLRAAEFADRSLAEALRKSAAQIMNAFSQPPSQSAMAS